jgi:hypothetical protein
VSAVWAELGSIFARTSPADTVSPTVTSTAVSVPVVAKSSDVVVAELTFPDAVTLAWTVPRPTVAVRVVLAVAAEDPPKTESRPKAIAIQTATTSNP